MQQRKKRATRKCYDLLDELAHKKTKPAKITLKEESRKMPTITCATERSIKRGIIHQTRSKKQFTKVAEAGKMEKKNGKKSQEKIKGQVKLTFRN